MRLLHRHDEDVRQDVNHDPDVDPRDPATRDQRTHRRSVFGFTRSHDRDDPDTTAVPDGTTRRERAAVAARDEAAVERDRAEAERDRALEREEIVERRKRWDTAGFLTAAYGAALAVMGALALVRTGVDDSWYRPVEEVAGVRHSPLLGAIELGVGVVVLLTLLLGLRAIAALVTFAVGVAATVVAIEPSRVNPELAIQRGWAVALAAVSLALGLLLVATRDRRRERRVIRRPVTA